MTRGGWAVDRLIERSCRVRPAVGRLRAMGDAVRWLMFMYQVPSEPSRLRTAVWRRLKALGAVYAAHSVAVLPESPQAERALRALRAEVGQMGARRSWCGPNR
jgi:hypothetical protein